MWWTLQCYLSPVMTGRTAPSIGRSRRLDGAPDLCPLESISGFRNQIASCGSSPFIGGVALPRPPGGSEGQRTLPLLPTGRETPQRFQLAIQRLLGGPSSHASYLLLCWLLKFVVASQPSLAAFNRSARRGAGLLGLVSQDQDRVVIDSVEDPPGGVTIRDSKFVASRADHWFGSRLRHRQVLSRWRRRSEYPPPIQGLTGERRRLDLAVEPDQRLVAAARIVVLCQIRHRPSMVAFSPFSLAFREAHRSLTLRYTAQSPRVALRLAVIWSTLGGGMR